MVTVAVGGRQTHTHTHTRATLKEETFAVQENREIFTFRGNKLSRMTSYEYLEFLMF